MLTIKDIENPYVIHDIKSNAKELILQQEKKTKKLEAIKHSTEELFIQFKNIPTPKETLLELKKRVARNPDHISELNLSEHHEISDFSFLRKCSSLKKLNISNTKIIRFCQIPFNNLEILVMDNCLHLQDIDVLIDAKKLRGISIINCINLTALPFNNCKDIEVINAKNCSKIQNLEDLQKCANLLFLNLTGCSGISYDQLKYLKNCKKLINLQLPN